MTPTHIRRERMTRGAEAFRTGKPLSDCPYAKNGEAWHDWMHGWRSAREGWDDKADLQNAKS